MIGGAMVTSECMIEFMSNHVADKSVTSMCGCAIILGSTVDRPRPECDFKVIAAAEPVWAWAFSYDS
jgi:hypothetical protein